MEVLDARDAWHTGVVGSEKLMVSSTASTKRFCQRWVGKAPAYNDCSLDEAFDKFFSLFVAFNRLYSHMARSRGQPQAPDRTAATELFALAIGHEALHNALLEADDDVKDLRNLIRPDGPFYLISDRGQDEPNVKQNRQLYEDLASANSAVAMKAVLTFLYQLRCNMFHGSKDFENQQLEIIRPANRVLDCVVREGLRKLESETA